MIHLVGESYEDDITLDNIHGLINTTSQETSEMSEVIEIAEESAMEDLVTGGRRAVLTVALLISTSSATPGSVSLCSLHLCVHSHSELLPCHVQVPSSTLSPRPADSKESFCHF